MKIDDKIKECRGVFVKYDTRIGKQIADYLEIRNQMLQIKRVSEYYTRKSEEFQKKFMVDVDPNNLIEEDDVLPLTGALYFIVMSYNRCFDTASTRKGKESRRVVKLQSRFLGKVDQSILDTHNQLKRLRDEFIAHAGANDLEKHELAIGLDYDSQVPMLKQLDGNGSHQLMATDEVKIDKIAPLVQIVIDRVDAKLNDLEVVAHQELNKISADPILFIDRLLNGQPITQQCLDKVKKV